MEKILEVRAGSHLYGLNTPTSDEDFFGIYIEKTDEILLDFYKNENQRGREIDLSIVSKNEDGKNSEDAVDRKFFSLKKYVLNALNCNPNILECLFADEKDIIFVNDIGRELIANRDMFLSKKAYHSFGSYADKQVKKAETKTPKHRRLKLCIDSLVSLPKKPTDDLVIYEEEAWFKKLFEVKKVNYAVVGTDYLIPKNNTVKRTIKEVRRIYDSMTSRRKIVDEHGYDTKFYSHTVRLLIEALDILENGTITLPLAEPYRLIVKRIKEGKITKEETEQMIKDLKEKVDLAFKTTKLPNNPNYEKAEQFIMKIYKKNMGVK